MLNLPSQVHTKIPMVGCVTLYNWVPIQYTWHGTLGVMYIMHISNNQLGGSTTE